MTFNPKNFRRITDESKPSFKIRNADYTTLILIESSGDAAYARTRTDKDQLVQRFDPSADLMLLAWGGQYHVDIFVLTQEDLDVYYK